MKETEKIVQNLKTSNACGYDEISSRVIKACSKAIISPLSHTSNQALAKGIFTSRLNFSIVKPLHKKGNKESISNYRPISLLLSFSKILEKVIFNRLYQHCIENNILSIHQYGLKLGSFMDKAIFNLINEIYDAFNKTETVGGIFCDL
jgi:hypothetical protein